MSRVIELFGRSTSDRRLDWQSIVEEQQCPFDHKKCFKTRKSEPEVSIGTCTVAYGKSQDPVIICPKRLLDRQRIFIDCMHLLTKHQPGNDYHLLPEISVPGGSVDFVLASANGNKVVDFVGIELQTLDTTGTVWPARQQFLEELGFDIEQPPRKSYGMNWKMTAKTILVQMNHKAETFESVNRHLVLVIQNPLLTYIRKEFRLSHFTSPADVTDTVHFHSYDLGDREDGNTVRPLRLSERISTDVAGIEVSLGLQSDAAVEENVILEQLSSRISPQTLFSPLA